MHPTASLLRDIPDFPEPGIVFKDITPVLDDASAFARIVVDLAAPYQDAGITHVVGIESRGFIVGAPVALELGAGFVPVRKPGKLPAETVSVSYDLEYGSDTIEMHADALEAGDRVLIVDDVIATGGTAAATLQIVRGRGAEVVGMAAYVELGFLNGRAKLGDLPITTLVVID
jgi:adenine phosphoribosyltransferase